eukprot:863577-Rhodomonas_salina.1
MACARLRVSEIHSRGGYAIRAGLKASTWVSGWSFGLRIWRLASWVWRLGFWVLGLDFGKTKHTDSYISTRRPCDTRRSATANGSR